MSPSEFDLRDVLRDGEDDADFNVDNLVLRARMHAAQRRVRILSAVTITAVAAGLGAGAAAIITNGHSTRPTASREDLLKLEPHAAGNGGGSSAVASPTAGAAGVVNGRVVVPVRGAAIGCPVSIDDLDKVAYGAANHAAVPFSTPVSTVVVCAYGTDSSHVTPALLQLHGRQAVDLTSSLNDAMTTALSAPTVPAGCPGTGKVGQQFAIIAYAPNGTALGSVQARFDSPCAATVTNGSAGLYEWLPPPALRTQFFSLTPK